MTREDTEHNIDKSLLKEFKDVVCSEKYYEELFSRFIVSRMYLMRLLVEYIQKFYYGYEKYDKWIGIVSYKMRDVLDKSHMTKDDMIAFVGKHLLQRCL